MYEIVLDTNVLVTALRSRRGASFQLLRRIDEGRFRVNVSVALALEYEEVLKRSDLLPGFSEADGDKFLNYLFQVSTLVPSVVLEVIAAERVHSAIERVWTVEQEAR